MKTSKIAKKTLKRLDRVEALLSKVIDHLAKDEKEVRVLLDSARTSVARAGLKAKTWIKAKSPIVKRSLTKATPAIQKKKRSRAEKNAKIASSADGKKRRKRILKSRTSNRSKTSKVAAAATETAPPNGTAL